MHSFVRWEFGKNQIWELEPGTGNFLDRMRKPRKRLHPLHQRLAKVKLFLCDVDGVLTDGAVFMGNGVETKRFNIRDGLGLRLLQKEGIKVGWISRRPSTATGQRAQDLRIDFLHQSEGSKAAAVEAILVETGLTWTDVCYVGDDIVDLSVMKRAGVAVAVADAIVEVKTMADHVTRAAGGHGAVREVVELILKAQSRWRRLIQEYSS
jgi:3-deoxy-D-manno-octulosonate 8-phosphate phosphatase (KDO 8-P phosphatase)